ncbi:MAG: hypothetical protein JWO67_4616 [Streptosporangiaceae bacterium]|jgi:hypothetical protein|nr:hypothetical protein [Streptosporangiaceae bacterium]
MRAGPADERDNRRRRAPECGPSEPVAPDREGRITAERAARLAACYVAEMTGKEPENLTSVQRTDDRGWRVDVEVVELRRIPETTDLLSVYQAELDQDGTLQSYRRTQRYTRGQVQGEPT